MLSLRKNIILLLIVGGLSQNCWSQNRAYAQSVIDSLSGHFFFGRGYLNNGDSKAAAYLREQFSQAGLLPIAGNYYHEFNLNVNTFPAEPILSTPQTALKAGTDFIVFPSSNSISQSFERILWVDENYLSKKCNYNKLLRKKYKHHLLILDTVGNDETLIKRREEVRKAYKGDVLIEVVRKLTWSVSRTVEERRGVQVLPGKLQKTDPSITLQIQNKLKTNYATQNVAGYFKGSEKPDSFIVLCGHYDHLGGMGRDVYFPGANDNASGIAMLLDMVNYYKENPPKYSVAFIGFAAEEAGLVGSYYWVKQSPELIPLPQIKFLINMDLMGSGDEGIMAVNGTVFKDAFSTLTSINKQHDLLPDVKARGKAANSDHYFFTEAGVPSFFFYLMGNYVHYHDVNDNAQELKLGPFYDRAFKLIIKFSESLME